MNKTFAAIAAGVAASALAFGVGTNYSRPAIHDTVTHTVVKNHVRTVEIAGSVLPPCDGEDDMQNCYWEADMAGNGKGRSFIVYGGEVWFSPDVAQDERDGVDWAAIATDAEHSK